MSERGNTRTRVGIEKGNQAQWRSRRKKEVQPQIIYLEGQGDSIRLCRRRSEKISANEEKMT